MIIIRYKIHYFTLDAGVFFFANPWRSTVCPRYFENGAPESFPAVDVYLSRREETKNQLSFDANVSSFSLAESPPRDLQITAYK